MNKKIIPLVGVLLVLGVGGFVYFQQKSAPQISPEVKKVQQEMMKNCSYDKEFCMYAANGVLAMSRGYTMTSESTYEGKKTKMVLKADGKENTESVTYSDGKEEGSFISLDKVTYMKSAGETTWTEFPVSKDETGKQTSGLFDAEGLKKELGDVAKEMKDSLVVKKVGSEKCGAYTCVIFEMTEKTMNTTTKVWVDTKEYLARKMEMQGEQGATVMTFEYGPVTIVKPSPIKKMPAFDAGAVGAGGNINMEEIQKMMKDVPQMSEETPAE